MALDLEEKAGGRVGRIEANGRSVLLAEGGSDGFEADPEAGALVAEDGTPAARTVEAAVGRAADDVGAGAGDDEDSWASGEGCVEGDFFVVAQARTAGMERPARPKQVRVIWLSEMLAEATTSSIMDWRRAVASASETRMSLTEPVEARARTRVESARRHCVLVPPASMARKKGMGGMVLGSRREVRGGVRGSRVWRKHRFDFSDRLSAMRCEL